MFVGHKAQIVGSVTQRHIYYCNVPKFLDTRKLCCNIPKIQINRGFPQKDANGIANSEDPDQTAPLGAV